MTARSPLPLSRTLLALVALILPACGESPGHRFEVHPTRGKVTRKGEPIPRAGVRFHPVDPRIVQPPEGQDGPPVMLTTETDENGEFSMSTYYADDGIPAGDYVVTVTTDPVEEDVENSDGPVASTPRRQRTGAKVYRDPATSPLKATVKTGENRFQFELD